MAKQMTGAEMVVEALKDQGVEMVFGYPGGAVLPIYDAIFHQNKLRHILVRHEQGAAPAAAPSTIIWCAASTICRASCTRPSTSRRTAGPARWSSTFLRTCNSPAAP